jgi:streptogramin lyase
MKKLYFIILFISLVSCTPVSHPVISSVTTNIKEMPTETAELLQTMQTQANENIIQRSYDPAEWKQIYDKDRVVKVEIGKKQQIWTMLDRGEIGVFDGNKWALFSRGDYSFSESPYDMAIAPDGSVWITGRSVISHYQNGHWNIFPLPVSSKTAFPRLAISPSGEVLVTPNCDCYTGIDIFNGSSWNVLPISGEKFFEAEQLLFTPDGTLWASFGWPAGIGRYNGKTWKNYSGTDLWPTGSYTGIRLASDNQGNIYAIYESQDWVIRINTDGSITKIPYDSSNLELNPVALRLFIDQQDTLWINAYLRNERNACLTYYKDNKWVSFTNLPFSDVSDINELPDGTLLVATSKGLYQFKSTK